MTHLHKALSADIRAFSRITAYKLHIDAPMRRLPIPSVSIEIEAVITSHQEYRGRARGWDKKYSNFSLEIPYISRIYFSRLLRKHVVGGELFIIFSST